MERPWLDMYSTILESTYQGEFALRDGTINKLTYLLLNFALSSVWS